MLSCILRHGMQARGYSRLFLSPRLLVFFSRGYSWLSVAIRGYLCSVAFFLAVRGYLFTVLWLSVAILGYPWLFLAISPKNSRLAIFSRG